MCHVSFCSRSSSDGLQAVHNYIDSFLQDVGTVRNIDSHSFWGFWYGRVPAARHRQLTGARGHAGDVEHLAAKPVDAPDEDSRNPFFFSGAYTRYTSLYSRSNVHRWLDRQIDRPACRHPPCGMVLVVMTRGIIIFWNYKGNDPGNRPGTRAPSPPPETTP